MSIQGGIWNFDGRPVDRKLLRGFSELMKEQGPDGDSTYVNGSVAMLYRPFHTTTESRREKQPHITRRGFVLTWDGRLDNRDELKRDLSDCLDNEPTDVDLVAAAFDHWETDCFHRIAGDWAVSIWRPKQNELVLAIDYIAVRHIFYYLTQDRIWWSTGLTPLVLQSVDKLHIDDCYIAGYFARDPDAHLTPFREIRKVPPGQFVRVVGGSTLFERHWRFSPKSRIRYKADADYEEHFRYVFRQSVHRRLRSDSPILAELSGGLDSSSIVCMADDIKAKEGFPKPILGTLSFYDRSEPNGDDWIYFRKVEEKRGQTGDHIDASTLASAPGSLEYSYFESLPGSLGLGCKLEEERAAVVRRGGYRVVLSGIGGDEFLGGIPNPCALLADSLVQFRLRRLRQQLTAWSLVKRRPWIHLLSQAVTELLPPSIGQYLLKQARVEPWISKDFAKRTKLAYRLIDVSDHFGFWLPTRRSCIGSVLMMANQISDSRPPTLAPEETRYPYLDQHLIEFILSIPASQLLRPGERRSLMRRSLKALVPAEVLSRKTKQFGARTPVVSIARNLDQLDSMFKAPLCSSLGYVEQFEFLKEFHAATRGKEIHIVHLMRTISFEVWLRDLVSRHLIEAHCDSQLSIEALACKACA